MVARVATLIETITLDFTSGTLLTAAIENAINFEANSDTRIKRGGSTVDYPAFSSIITSFGSFADYTFIGGITGQIIAVVHGIEDDFSRRIEEVKILDGKLVSYELTGSSPITDISYSVKSLTLAPGSYDPGAAVADYTIDVTAFDAGGGLSSGGYAAIRRWFHHDFGAGRYADGESACCQSHGQSPERAGLAGA